MIPWLNAAAWVLIVGGFVLTPVIAWTWLVVWCRYLVPHASLQCTFIWMTLLAMPSASVFAILAIRLPVHAADIAYASLLLAVTTFVVAVFALIWNCVLIHKAEQRLQEDIARMQRTIVLQS
ncbi:MAG TPA: hypothetical protein PKD28_01225 [Candidatus Saccharibacteria bacterium]|nr:hypothetical protein [Candidatus Saccharibacteria bacterium]